MTYTNSSQRHIVNTMSVREERCVLQGIGTCQDVQCAATNNRHMPTSTGPQKTPANSQKRQ